MSSSCSRSAFRFGFSLIFLVLIHLNLSAQTEGERSGGYTCGSDWARQVDYEAALEITRQNNPALYQRMVAGVPAYHEKEGQVLAGLPFWVNSRTGQGFQSVEATLMDTAGGVWVWLVDDYVQQIAPSTIEKLMYGLAEHVKEGPNTRNAEQGVMANDIAIFGDPPRDVWSDGLALLHVLLLNIESPIDGGVISGYFSAYDQTSNPGSNNRNLLYIDLRQLLNQNQAAVDKTLGTIAHEFQHLINFNRYTGIASQAETHWIYNEGLSEVASLRNGYHDRTATEYLRRPNRFAYFDAPIGSGNADTILRAYQRSMLWVHYLSEQFGDEFLYELVAAPGNSLDPVRTAMQRSGNGDTATNVFAAFWTANYLQDAGGFSGDPIFQYQYPLGGIAGTTQKFDSAGLATESETIKGYGAFLPRYFNTDSLEKSFRVRFLPGSSEYKVHAVIFQNTGTIAVQPMEVDQEYLFERFTGLVFVIVNTNSSDRTITWTLERGTVSVHDTPALAADLDVTGVRLNPNGDQLTLDLLAGRSGNVALEFFTVQGERVLPDGNNQWLDAGERRIVRDVSTLPSGTYLLRLRSAHGAVLTRPFALIR